MKEIVITVPDENEDSRIDSALAGFFEEYSRSYIQKLIKDGLVLVSGRPVKANYRVAAGDTVTVSVPDETVPDILPENIPLDILYEDDDILIVNKPKQMVVHPAAGHYTGTLVNAVMYHCGDRLSGINGVLRPGIVHRIDMDTTGCLAVCKTDRAHKALAADLAVHNIKRKYRAIVIGTFKEEDFTVSAPVGRSSSDRKKMAVDTKSGREAVTDVHVIQNLKGYSYIECTLHSGRTHQIRVHMKHIGHPVLGDTVYGPAKQNVKGLTGQTLHAYLLGFNHPVTGEYVEFTAPLPDYFQDLLKKLA